MPTQTGPDTSGQSGIWGKIADFGFTAANRWLDTELPSDTNNIPDVVDLRTGQVPQYSPQRTGTQLSTPAITTPSVPQEVRQTGPQLSSVPKWALYAGGAVVLLVIAKMALKD